MKMGNVVTMTKESIFNLAEDKLIKYGCDDSNASAVARTITDAELDGCSSHGLFRLPGFVASLKSGKANGRAGPEATRIAPGVIRVDGDRGFAPLALNIAH